MSIIVVESDRTRRLRESEAEQLEARAAKEWFGAKVRTLARKVSPIADEIEREKVLKLCKLIDPGGSGIVIHPTYTREQVARLIADVLLGPGADWEKYT